MGAPATCRPAHRADLGLSAPHFAALARLPTPVAIQAFVTRLPANHEPDGETVRSVAGVLRHRRAHCIEAAFVAACALWIHGRRPLLMHLACADSDYPHVVALFRDGRHWGAISKSNGASLRFRDPVYRSLRELALSYFHEYCDRGGRRTLRAYSPAFDLARLPATAWVSRPDDCWDVHDRLAALRHYPLVTPAQARRLSRRDAFERASARVAQHPRPAATRAGDPAPDAPGSAGARAAGPSRRR